jgi:hypothetical protein
VKNVTSSKSNYTATMYAVVHPFAVKCKGPNHEEYDRVKVLSDLGYQVMILGSPIGIKDVEGYVKENINKEAGERDYMKLWPLTFDNHPIVGKLTCHQCKFWELN